MLDPKYVKPITIGMVHKLVKAVYSMPRQQWTLRSIFKRGLRLSNDYGESEQERHTTKQIELQKQKRLLAELDLVISMAKEARQMVANDTLK